MRRCKSLFNERNSCILIRLTTHLHRCNAQSDMSIFYRAKQLHTPHLFIVSLIFFYCYLDPVVCFLFFLLSSSVFSPSESHYCRRCAGPIPHGDPIKVPLICRLAPQLIR